MSGDSRTTTHPPEQTTVLRTPRRPPPNRRPGLPALITAGVAVVAVGLLGFAVTRHSTTTLRSDRLGQGTAPTTSSVPTTDTRGTTVPSTTTAPERLTAASRLTLQGIGPVRIGMTLSEASAAAGVPIRLLDMPPGPDCRYAVPDRASGTGDELGFMVIDGRIVRIDVGIMGPDRIRTLSGIGKGNTEAEVQATYPGRIRVQAHPYIANGRYLVYVPSDPGLRHLSMIFETVDGQVRSFRAGLAEQVSWTEGCS